MLPTAAMAQLVMPLQEMLRQVMHLHITMRPLLRRLVKYCLVARLRRLVAFMLVKPLWLDRVEQAVLLAVLLLMLMALAPMALVVNPAMQALVVMLLLAMPVLVLVIQILRLKTELVRFRLRRVSLQLLVQTVFLETPVRIVMDRVAQAQAVTQVLVDRLAMVPMWVFRIIMLPIRVIGLDRLMHRLLLVRKPELKVLRPLQVLQTVKPERMVWLVMPQQIAMVVLVKQAPQLTWVLLNSALARWEATVRMV